MAAGISIREFARREGCSDTLVRRAVKERKLAALPDGTLDPKLVGSEWKKGNRGGANTPPPVRTTVRTANPGDTIDPSDMTDEDFIAAVLAGQFKLTGEAERVKENALAAKHLLAARREAGDLVDLETAEAVLFEAARAVRDAWMNFPSRIGPVLAAELGVEADRMVEALSVHVQQQLQDLGEPDPDFAPAVEA